MKRHHSGSAGHPQRSGRSVWLISAADDPGGVYRSKQLHKQMVAMLALPNSRTRERVLSVVSRKAKHKKTPAYTQLLKRGQRN